jgi:hypothetical protein
MFRAPSLSKRGLIAWRWNSMWKQRSSKRSPEISAKRHTAAGVLRRRHITGLGERLL